MADDSSNKTDDELSFVGRRVATSCFTLEGILGIACALYSLRRSIQHGSSRGGYVNFFTSLAVADLGIATLCPITAYASSMASGGWPFSTEACDMYGFVALFFGSLVIWSLLMSVLEDEHIGTRMSIALLPLAWTNALFWSAVPFLGWGRYTPERYGAGCLYDMDVHDFNNFSFMIGYTVFTLIVPLVILLSCSSKASSNKGLVVALTSLCLCWGLYGVEEIWAVVTQDKGAVPIQLVTAAPIAAKLSPIINAIITARSLASQKSKVK